MTPDKIKQAAEDHFSKGFHDNEDFNEWWESEHEVVISNFTKGAQFILDQASEGFQEWFNSHSNRKKLGLSLVCAWVNATISAEKRHREEVEFLKAKLDASEKLREFGIPKNTHINKPTSGGVLLVQHNPPTPSEGM